MEVIDKKELTSANQTWMVIYDDKSINDSNEDFQFELKFEYKLAGMIIVGKKHIFMQAYST